MRWRLLPLGVASVAIGFVAAHVRLIYSGNGNVLFWDNPSSVAITINETGSDNISDGSHIPALRDAIYEWNKVDNTTAFLVENTSPSEMASTDWQSDSRHLIYFDENNSSGYFPGASGIVAVTPLTFFTSGSIIDADVLFNGKNFLFTTSGVSGRYDVADVATHELGHLLGLDHSGCAGASMYPYVDPTILLHRSLSMDDIHGLQHMYPMGTFSRISGTLQRTVGGSPVAGAWVGARDSEGRTVGAVLSNISGQFSIPSLTPGTYDIYVTPLDGPVDSLNLTSGHVIHTDFESQVLGSASPGAGQTVSIGTHNLDADVSVHLGSVADDYPLRCISGQGNSLTVRGTGLVAGSTLTASDSSVILSGISWGTTSVTFTATPSGADAPGHVDLMVTTPGGDSHILSAGLEITPPDPTVTLVSPSSGAAAGGDAMTITGTNFNPGAHVVMGGQRYVDGWSCTVVNSTTITLTTKSTDPGSHDVVVIDETGVEGRSVGAFTSQAIPIIASVFPEGGNFFGGTTITILGRDFDPGCVVEIDGVNQAGTTVVNENKITVVTSAGAPGGPYVLEVREPGGATANAAFTYSTKADPAIINVTPDEGSSEGGETITVTGSNFTVNTEVVFGVNASTGDGGVAAPVVNHIDANTLEVTTPATAIAGTAVMVRETDTGQGHILAGAFAFEGSGGSGGGGCGTVMPAKPPTIGRALGGAGWVVVLALLLGWRARRSARLVGYRACPGPA